MISEIGENFRLKDFLNVPSVHINLLSTNKFTNNGCTMTANSEKIHIIHGKRTITLPMNSEGGRNMYCVTVTRTGSPQEISDCAYETDSTELKMPKCMDINVAHEYCHLGGKLLKATFRTLGVKLTDTLKACDGCCRANARAKGVSK